MKQAIALISTLSAAAFAAPVFAGGPVEVPAEPVIAAPVPVVAPSFDWTGGYVGAQLGYGDLGAAGTALDGNGAIGGLHAGYLVDMGQFVAGGELEYNKSNIKLGGAGDTLDHQYAAKLIGGYDLGRTLVYATAGVSRAEATVGGASVGSTGYLVGVGADYRLNDQWTLGGELSNNHYNDFGGTGADLDAATLKAKLSYRF